MKKISAISVYTTMTLAIFFCVSTILKLDTSPLALALTGIGMWCLVDGGVYLMVVHLRNHPPFAFIIYLVFCFIYQCIDILLTGIVNISEMYQFCASALILYPVYRYENAKYLIGTARTLSKKYFDKLSIDYDTLMAGLLTETGYLKEERDKEDKVQFVCEKSRLQKWSHLFSLQQQYEKGGDMTALAHTIGYDKVTFGFIKCIKAYIALLKTVEMHMHIDSELHADNADAKFPLDLSKRRWKLVDAEKQFEKRIKTIHKRANAFNPVLG